MDLVTPLVVPAILALFVVVTVVLSLREQKAVAAAFLRRWERLREGLGLACADETGAFAGRGYRLSGTRAGRAVEVRFHVAGKQAWTDQSQALPASSAGVVLALTTPTVQPDFGWTIVRVQVAAPLPAGLRLRHESAGSEALRYLGIEDAQLGDTWLDSHLHVSVDDLAGARALAATEPGNSALRRLAGREGMVLEDGWLDARVAGERPQDVEALLEEVGTVADELEQAVLGRLSALARRRGLALEGQPATGAAGVVSGLQVAARIQPEGTWLTVALPESAPAGLRIAEEAPRDSGAGHVVALANPLLSRVIDVRAVDLAAAARVLASDQATEDVLAVVKAHPGAMVSSGRVVVPLPGAVDAAALDEVLTDAVRLARRLGGAST